MTKLNHQSRIRSKVKIDPSTRDSISTWLDVLTAMLVMPDTQRLQVRDELEDHLRSRVDDLLIMGKPEPEAIRIAVAELGETAELAKLITHAHTRINPRRKIMNAALITVALAGMSFGGFSFITGTGAPSATPSSGGAVPVVIPEEARKEIAQSEPQTRMVNIEDQPLLFTIQQVASIFGYTLNAQSLPENMVRDMQNRLVTVYDEYTIEGVMQYLIKSSLQHGSVLTTEIHGNVIELLTHDEIIRRETQVKTYSIGWSNFETAENIAYTLQNIIGNGQHAQFFKMSFVGDQIVIDARPQAHKQIEEILAHTKEGYERIVRQEREERTVAIERIQEEFDRVRDEYIASGFRIGDDYKAIRQLEIQLQSEDLQSKNREAIEAKLADFSGKGFEMELRRDEYEERYNYLRTRLIESQYANLFEGLE